MRWSEQIRVAVLVVVFAPALLSLIEVWRSVDYYSHGFAIPVFSVAAFLPLRRRLAPASAAGGGFAVIAAALGLYLLGLAAGSAPLQGFALVTAVVGEVVIRWGWAGLRVLAFPVGFLLFMVPLPNGLVAPTIIWLQSVVSALATGLLGLGGVEVVREGNVLTLPGGERLFVAEACSGITSIITLLPLGAFVAYYTIEGWTRRLLVVACVVPLAMLGNMLRVLVTVLAAERVGAEVATSGTAHDLTGMGAFALACLGLLGVARMLRSAPSRNAASHAA
jgi:exosortase